MKGTLYGVGVGPGDPELMTLKAARLVREADCVAVPGERAEESAAYRIAAQAVPELAEKRLLAIPMPMTRDPGELAMHHRRGADRLEAVLAEGTDVVFLTLGDPTVYSTFSFLQRLAEADGYPTALVSGVPSFCAAAARLNAPLVEQDEPLHVYPAAYSGAEGLELPGSVVLMKTGRRLPEVRESILRSGKAAALVENCGMAGERICHGAAQFPDRTGYFALIVAKEAK